MPTLQNHSSAISVFLSPLLVSLCDTAFTHPTAAFMSNNVQVLLRTPDHTHCSLEATSTAHKLHHLTVLQFPSPTVWVLVALTESVDCSGSVAESPAPAWILRMEPMVISGACHHPSLLPCFQLQAPFLPGFIFTENSS